MFSLQVNYSRKKTMEFLDFDPNTKLTAIYYNGGKPPHLFRIHNDVTLSGLKDQLDQINCQLNHRHTRRVVGVEYRCPLSDSAGSPQFNRMKLANDDDMRTMFSLVSTVLEDRLSWTFRWLDLLNKL